MLLRFWGRKPESIIREYIDQINSDSIVDPFGGSGEIVKIAAEIGKKATYMDINPYAWLVAFVNTQKINAKEFFEKSKEVLELAEWDHHVRVLKHDKLVYPDGTPFLKRGKVKRVSELFTKENFKKLYAILKGIDKVEANPSVKIALYGLFCAILFNSSTMKRKNAGSWGIPNYWIPKNHENRDPIEEYKRFAKRFYNEFKRRENYDISLRIGNALTYKYPKNVSLFTDPPFFDEIQYAELSQFYLAWLRSSKFFSIAKLLSVNPKFYRSKELIVNKNRGFTLNMYLERFSQFLEKTKKVKEKILIFHEENSELLKNIIEMTKNNWGYVTIHEITIAHRNIGEKGGNKYVVIISKKN